MPQFDEFFRELDQRWLPSVATPLTLRLIGSTALFAQTAYVRHTKDSDVIETAEVTPPVRAELERLGGKGSELHLRHRMFVEVVGAAFPFLPREPAWRAVNPLVPPLQHLHFEALDVVDVAVAKLARYNLNDRGDIRAMADLDLVDPDYFLERFRSAVDVWSIEARGDDLPKIVRHFRRVWLDDLFQLSAPEIILPDWIANE